MGAGAGAMSDEKLNVGTLDDRLYEIINSENAHIMVGKDSTSERRGVAFSAHIRVTEAIRTALTAAEARGAQRERARYEKALEDVRASLREVTPAAPVPLQSAYLEGAHKALRGVEILAKAVDP